MAVAAARERRSASGHATAGRLVGSCFAAARGTATIDRAGTGQRLEPQSRGRQERARVSYVRRVLEPGEAVLYATTVHWLVYGPAIFMLIIAIACFAAAGGTGDSARGVLLIAAAIFLLLALLSWLPAALRRASTELVVTDRRVIYKSGLFSRHTIEMNRTKVESVDVDQSIAGRLLGYGTVTVHGTGGTLEPIRSVARPLTFRSHITAA
jgi:uncharacterized membrane protein YdbT with pleckstrin-like domain